MNASTQKAPTPPTGSISNYCDDEYVQSWYPVSRSDDLKKGKHQAVTLFGKDWILFRTKSGGVSFLRRHCCHMGADLCQGQVVDETIQCPLHAWQFDVSGKCVHIPNYSDDKKPLPERFIHHLKCKEKYGLIFVFWGEIDLFSIPSPPDISDQQICSKVLTKTFDTDHKVLSLNSYDTQHFKHVHNRNFVTEPDIYTVGEYALRIDFETEVYKRQRWVDHVLSSLQTGSFNISIECWGVNLMTLKNHEFNSCAMVALQPINKHRTKAYLVSIKEHYGKPSVLDKLRLLIAVHLFKNFLMADLKATKNIRLHQAGLVEGLDDGAKTYWKFFQSLPRIKRRRKSE